MITRRYSEYCRARKQEPAKVKELDRKEWPSMPANGFLQWHKSKVKEFASRWGLETLTELKFLFPNRNVDEMYDQWLKISVDIDIGVL